MCKFIKDLFTKEWTLDDKILCVTIGTLMGIIIGFFASPISKGERRKGRKAVGEKTE